MELQFRGYFLRHLEDVVRVFSWLMFNPLSAIECVLDLLCYPFKEESRTQVKTNVNRSLSRVLPLLLMHEQSEFEQDVT